MSLTPHPPQRQRRLRLLFGSLALLAAIWTTALYAGYGQSLSLGALRISSRNPIRPLALCLAAIAAYAFVSGRTALRKDLSSVRRGACRYATVGGRGFIYLETRVPPAVAALLIAAISVTVSLWFRESTAGGSDAYSYVTQADLWSDGAPGLRVEMPIASAAPWPSAIETFTPFGYRSTPDRRAVVPVTAPGLPLLMAAFKTVAGHCAMSWVVPITGGLLVWATFLVGQRIASGAVGAFAAWLVATSPTVLSMSRSIMSDVPAAAFWALSTGLTLGVQTGGKTGWPQAAAFCAGSSATVATLIRPNLLPVGLVLGLWILWRDIRTGSTRIPVRSLAFAAGALPGCVAIAAVNYWLYGSAGSSGYGDLNSLFSLANVATNCRRYFTWLLETQTPFALAGMAALLVPWRRLWPTAASRAGARLLAVILVIVIAVYLAYTPFSDWWYLRFLLPAWPAIFVGTSALFLGIGRGRADWLRIVSAVAVVLLGLHGLLTARRLGVFPTNEGERRYATIAGLVAGLTDPSSVIVTTAHVGPMRYYGGRLTVRYDVLDAGWLDRMLEWFVRQGRHPYILLEEQEVPEFRQRFGSTSATGRLEMTPILDYEAHSIPGRVYLFDPLNSAPTTWRPSPIENPQPRCPLPTARPPDYRVRSP